MTDLSILSQLPPKVSTAAAGTLLHAITSISEHALLNVQQIYRAPSLRDIARSLLASRLKDVLPVANPDIYFISRAGSSAVECSVTDGLLQALLQGPDTSRATVSRSTHGMTPSRPSINCPPITSQ